MDLSRKIKTKLWSSKDQPTAPREKRKSKNVRVKIERNKKKTRRKQGSSRRRNKKQGKLVMFLLFLKFLAILKVRL